MLIGVTTSFTGWVLVGPNMDSDCVASRAQCCTGGSVSFWYVSPFDEKYLPVERRLSVAASGKARSR